jgi:hypothetical protein
MTELNALQLRYLRNSLTTWVLLVALYSTFWWALPFGYGELTVAVITGAFIYGGWLFRD